MAILPIKIFPDPVLRRSCEEVHVVGEAELQLIEDMKETMFAAPGAGLAAPQVGELLQIVIVNMADEKHPDRCIVLINPKIVEMGGDMVTEEEGCLSIPGYQTDIKRYTHARVEYINEKGQPREIDGHNFLARVFQHEIDHLNGILFIDYLGRVRRDLVKRKLIKGAKKRA